MIHLITTSDWHLRSTVPCSRAESDWYEVMEAKILDLFQMAGNTPILIAGDLFDRPDPPASLVSWAISMFKQAIGPVFCTPGQHDLKNHVLDDRMDGAYGALAKAGVIIDLPINEWFDIKPYVAIYAMPWGEYRLPVTPPPRDRLTVAALHKYAWITNETKYVGATGESNVLGISSYAQHFDAIAIGDNHIPWNSGKFINHGSLFGFASNQQDHVPLIGILTDEGYEARRFPDPVPALWQPNLGSITTEGTLSVVECLQTTDNAQVNFRESLRRLSEESTDNTQRGIYTELNSAVFSDL